MDWGRSIHVPAKQLVTISLLLFTSDPGCLGHQALFMRVENLLVADPALFSYLAWLISADCNHIDACIYQTSVCACWFSSVFLGLSYIFLRFSYILFGFSLILLGFPLGFPRFCQVFLGPGFAWVFLHFPSVFLHLAQVFLHFPWVFLHFPWVFLYFPWQ